MSKKDLGYVNIQRWMYNIGLSNISEVLLFAIVYGFSQDGESQFHGSLSYIEDLLMCSKNTAIKTIKSLCDKGLIEKIQQEKCGIVFNSYKSVVSNCTTGSNSALPVQNENYGSSISEQGSANFEQGSANFAPNNNIDNNSSNNTLLSCSPTINSSPTKIDSDNKKENKKKKSLEERDQEFKESLFGYIRKGMYDKDLVQEFYEYWSEPTQDKTKMRWELQKTWDTTRRLATWSKNKIEKRYGNTNAQGNLDPRTENHKALRESIERDLREIRGYTLL